MITESSKIYNDLNLYIKENTIFTNLRLSFVGRYIWMMFATDAVFALVFLVDLLFTLRCRARQMQQKQKRLRK